MLFVQISESFNLIFSSKLSKKEKGCHRLPTYYLTKANNAAKMCTFLYSDPCKWCIDLKFQFFCMCYVIMFLNYKSDTNVSKNCDISWSYDLKFHEET